MQRFPRPRASDVFPRPRASDVIAGASVALVLIPQSVAYADIAGMPAQIGLFASGVPLVVFSLFASSPFLQSGPTAVTSLLTLSALAATGHAESTPEWIRAGALLALIVAVTRLILGIVRGGRVVYAVAEPVMIGFTSGAAVVIFCSQLPKVLGVTPPSDMRQPVQRALWSLGQIADWQVAALAIGALTLVLMLGARRLHPLIPGVLIAMILGVVISRVVGLDGRWERAVASDPNPIPGDFPSLGFDLPWSEFGSVIVGGLVIAVIGFAEPSSIARTYANEERQEWDANRELFASGVANFSSSVLGAYPIGGSFSRSSLNKMAGAKTRWAGGVTGLLVLAFLPLAPLLDDLPNAALGAIVIGAVLSLMKPRRLAAMWPRSRSQALLTWLTAVLTIAFAPEVYWAVIIGAVLTMVHHRVWPVSLDIHHDVHGSDTTPGSAVAPSGSEADSPTRSDHGGRDGVLRIRPTGLVWLASNAAFARQLADACAASDAPDVVIDLSATPSVDADMAAVIADQSLSLAGDGRRLTLRDAPDAAAALVESAIELRSDSTPPA